VSKENHDGDPMEGYASGKQVQFNMEWYGKLRASKPSWKFNRKYTVEPNNGHAIYIDAGQVFRFVQVDGPNICDVHFFGAKIDLLVLAVHCPYGNQTKSPMEADHYPIDVEIWDTGITPQPSPKWHDWRPAHKAKIDRLKAEGDTTPRNRTFD